MPHSSGLLPPAVTSGPVPCEAQQQAPPPSQLAAGLRHRSSIPGRTHSEHGAEERQQPPPPPPPPHPLRVKPGAARRRPVPPAAWLRSGGVPPAVSESQGCTVEAAERPAWRCPSMMFNWHRSFSLGLANPWKKGKKKIPPDSKVVLTNVKMLSNGYPTEMMLPGESTVQHDFCETDGTLNCQDNDLNTNVCQSKEDYAPAFSDVASVQSICKNRVLYKFESEDSGVELPSGANSPSTPTGSEQSFVVHSRDSSCDSGVLSTSSSPAIDHTVMRACKDTKEPNNCIQESTEEGKECNIVLKEPLHQSAAIFNDLSVPPENDNHSQLFAESPKTYEEKNDNELEFLPTGNPSTASANEPIPITDAYSDSFDGLQERNLHGQLKRYPTSDSLDEYMDECCRLSEVNQGSAKALGPGLGYLEHICQLIEKIGQLQEHNLRLQKQICGLQKEKKMKQLKEEYFIQHCSCGAARALRNSYQEAKKHFNTRSRPHSMFIQTGNLSDLSMIPEMGGHSEGLACRGSDSHMESRSNALMLGLRETSNRTACEENEAGHHVWNRADGATQHDQALRRVENHPWGRVRDLVKKTKLKNTNKLGLSSMALKRSCPQLYRPDITSSEPKKKDRNSMILLGQSPPNDGAWPY